MDFVKLASQGATPDVLAAAAGLLGVPEGAVRKGLGAAIPGALAGLVGAAKARGAADALGAALGRSSELADLAARDPAAAAATGSDLLTAIIGRGTAGTLAGVLAGYAGLPRPGAGSLLGLAGTMVLAAVGRAAADKGLDAKGVFAMLDAQKDAIARALPADFARALGGTVLMAGLGDRGTGARSAGTAPVADPAPPAPSMTVPLEPLLPTPPKRSWLRWAPGLVLIAVVVWFAMQIFGPAPIATTVAPATQTDAVDPLMSGSVDVGAEVRGALAGITSAFGAMTDASSAEAALPKLAAARDTLAGLEGPVAALSPAGHDALKTMITAAMPGVQSGADSVLTDAKVVELAGPVVTDILARLDAFSS